MIDPAKLSVAAQDACLQHVESLFEGEYLVEVLNHSTQWNRRELRSLFEQSMTVWRKYGEFDVILDANDTPVGYIDHDKWADCAWRDLSAEQVKAIVNPYDPLRADLVVRELKRGERDSLEARICVADDVEFLVRINPARGVIISFLPVEGVQA